MHQRIIFRADGNSNIGLGHVYRIIALYELLNAEYSCIFLSRDPNAFINGLKSEERIVTVPKKLNIYQEAEWIENRFSVSDHIIITDGYQFDSEYQKMIKSLGYKLICIDDLAENHMYSDLVINHSLAIKESNYSAELYTKFALGSSYILLRKCFLDAGRRLREIKVLENIFICFGGADPDDLTLRATESILKFDFISNIHVVLGNEYSHYKIHKLKDPRLSLHSNLNGEEMMGVMTKCEIAIASASTISYELCCVNILLFGGYYVDNQRLLHKGLIENGLIIDCGNFNKFNFKNINLQLDSELIKNQLFNQNRFFNGSSIERFKSKISEYVN